MSNTALSATEKEMANYDFNALHTEAEAAKAKIATAKTAADVKAEICKIWAKIKPYVTVIEKLPFVGKFFTILADILNTLCG